MRRVITLIALVTLCALMIVPYTFAQESYRMAPDFKLRDIYQNTFTLSEYRGRQPVLLFFWATWCPFCQKELSVLKQEYAGLAEGGLEVLAIDVGERPSTVEDFVKSYYLNYQVLLDRDTSVANSFRIVGIPVYVLVDKQGFIVS